MLNWFVELSTVGRIAMILIAVISMLVVLAVVACLVIRRREARKREAARPYISPIFEIIGNRLGITQDFVDYEKSVESFYRRQDLILLVSLLELVASKLGTIDAEFDDLLRQQGNDEAITTIAKARQRVVDARNRILRARNVHDYNEAVGDCLFLIGEITCDQNVLDTKFAIVQ